MFLHSLHLTTKPSAKNKSFNFICISILPLCMSVYLSHLYSVPGGQKRVLLDPVRLELETFVNCQGYAGSLTIVHWKSK